MLDDADDEVFVTIVSFDEQIHGAFNEIASNDSKIRIRGYRRLHAIADDYCGRPMLDYDDKAESIFDRLKGMKGRPATKICELRRLRFRTMQRYLPERRRLRQSSDAETQPDCLRYYQRGNLRGRHREPYQWFAPARPSRWRLRFHHNARFLTTDFAD